MAQGIAAYIQADLNLQQRAGEANIALDEESQGGLAAGTWWKGLIASVTETVCTIMGIDVPIGCKPSSTSRRTSGHGTK